MDQLARVNRHDIREANGCKKCISDVDDKVDSVFERKDITRGRFVRANPSSLDAKGQTGNCSSSGRRRLY